VCLRNQSCGDASVICLRSSSYHLSLSSTLKFCDLALKFVIRRDGELSGYNPAIERYDDLFTPSLYVKPFAVKSDFFNSPFN
jgi:hypothetical protein